MKTIAPAAIGLALLLTFVTAPAFPDLQIPSAAPANLTPARRLSSDANTTAVAETRTYLKRLEKLGFAGVVLVAEGDAPLFAEGFGLADR